MGQPFPPPTPPPGPQPAAQRPLLTRLFDLSFTEFVTPSVVKVIFVLGIVMSALSALMVLVTFAASGSAALIILGLIFAVLAFFFSVLYSRILAEIFLILFRIEENTRRR